jgi:CRP-like cAMP-binding protein
VLAPSEPACHVQRLFSLFELVPQQLRAPKERERPRLLLRLATSRGTKGRLVLTDTVTVTVSHNELAQLAGMSRPHVTVTMGRLRRRHLVQYERESLVRVAVASLTNYLGRIVRGERA